MNSLVALSCLLAAVSATPSAYITPYGYSTYPTYAAYSAPALAPITVEKTQYHAQDTLGQASYGHSEPLQSHNAVQDAAGNKAGSYNYVAPDGQVFATSYVADALGYRVATNAMPIGPSALPIAPAETPEVQAARAAHLNAHALVRSRARRSIVAPLGYSGVVAPFATSYSSLSTPVVHYNTPLVAGHGYPYLY